LKNKVTESVTEGFSGTSQINWANET
jgi:hypothetical protein